MYERGTVGILGELFPEILEADTSFMQGADLNIEALLALDPDVVFCSSGNREMIAALENAQIPAVGISPANGITIFWKPTISG